MLTADGFDEAILGIVERCSKDPIVCYDYEKCMEILKQRDGMTDGEAAEWMGYNVTGAWMGEGTPCFLHRLTRDEIDEYADEYLENNAETLKESSEK